MQQVEVCDFGRAAYRILHFMLFTRQILCGRGDVWGSVLEWSLGGMNVVRGQFLLSFSRSLPLQALKPVAYEQCVSVAMSTGSDSPHGAGVRPVEC